MSLALEQPKTLGMPSVLQAASLREPGAQDGDGISSDWLIAELTHRQAHGLKLQYRAYPVAFRPRLPSR